MTTQSSPIITEMKVIPVAGHDSMLLNIGGAHNAWFTRNIVVLTDNAGHTGVGEAPGGEVIYQTLLAAIPQVVGQEVARLNRVVQQVHKGNQAADFDTFGKGAWTFELKVNAVAALEAALLDLLGQVLNVPVCELLGPGKQRDAVTVLGYLFYIGDRQKTDLGYLDHTPGDHEWYRLRDPENGCPWDKEQTFATIAPYTLEETYEVLDAIQREDFDDLRGELGDLLFQVVFYAQMAQEEGRFNFDDICAAISDKLERRHPHIFGEASAGNSTEVLARWEQIKSAERAEKAQHSALDDIPHSLPALMRAHKIQRRCSAVGFDWTSLGPVLDKVHEEIDEVMHEAQQAVVDEAKLEEEVGDLLFATVNLSRHLGVKAEVALQKANLKFERRFREVERIVAARGLEMTGVDLDTMEEVWQEVKRQETDL